MNPAIKGVGETVLRVKDLERMTRFYQKVLCLELYKVLPDRVYFKINEGNDCHTQLLGLCSEEVPFPFTRARRATIEQASTTLHHFALEIDSGHFDSELARLQSADCEMVLDDHPDRQCRSMYLRDPELNVIELLCYDPSVTPEEAGAS